MDFGDARSGWLDPDRLELFSERWLRVLNTPSGHRLLIDQLSEPIPDLRPALLSRELAARIDDHRRFRHAFRHMYFFDLDWARLRPLASGGPALLADFDQAVDALFSQLGA